MKVSTVQKGGFLQRIPIFKLNKSKSTALVGINIKRELKLNDAERAVKDGRKVLLRCAVVQIHESSSKGRVIRKRNQGAVILGLAGDIAGSMRSGSLIVDIGRELRYLVGPRSTSKSRITFGCKNLLEPFDPTENKF